MLLLADLQDHDNADISFDATQVIDALTAAANSLPEQTGYMVAPSNGCNPVSTYLNTIHLSIPNVNFSTTNAAIVDKLILSQPGVVSVSVDAVTNRATLYSNKYSNANCSVITTALANAGYPATAANSASSSSANSENGYVNYPGVPLKQKGSLALAVYKDVGGAPKPKTNAKVPLAPAAANKGIVGSLTSWFW